MITDIQNIIGLVVQDMRDDGIYEGDQPYYMYGHRMEIAQRLREKDNDRVYKYQKYPLIALRLPTSCNVNGNIRTFTNLNIAFIDFTQKNYNSIERFENVINPILEPMYMHFLEKCRDSSWIEEIDYPTHTKSDKLFYGIEGAEGNESYIFDDPLDAIELTNLQITIIDKTC